MRRRLLIARALVHRPRLLLLDEPTVGLDPQVRQELWALIDRLRSEGTSILMSTHYIEEAERLADRSRSCPHGKAVALGRAGGAGARARRPRGARGVRAAGAARGGRGRSAEAAGLRVRRTGTAIAILRAETATAPEGEHAPGQPRGRLRAADRGGDRMSAGTAVPRVARPAGRLRRRLHRLEPAGDRGRDEPRRHNFSTYWKRDDVLVDPSSRRSTCSRSASASARSWPRSAA